MNPEPRMLIDGELVDAESGATYNNINPATEAVMGQCANAGWADTDRAIAAARRAFDATDWSTNHALRLDCLRQLKAGLLTELDELQVQIAAETGAPLGICGANGPQCGVPINFIDHSLELLDNYQWSRDIGWAEVMGIRSRRLIEKDAVGVVACITPWNFPLQINLAKCTPHSPPVARWY